MLAILSPSFHVAMPLGRVTARLSVHLAGRITTGFVYSLKL